MRVSWGLILGLGCMGFLVGCNTMNPSRDYSYESSGGYYDANQDPSMQPLFTPYANSYANGSYVGEDNAVEDSGRVVTVPETYHVGAYHSPVSSKDRDKQWVSEQNPAGYTIEIADSEKASQVANTLYQAPKNEHMAEVPYSRNGGAHYKGLYGSYGTYEAAQKALQGLPDALKQQAGIKSWRDIQGTVNE